MDYEDEKIVSIMKRYRPSGPPAELKEKIFRSKEKLPQRIWLAIAASIVLAAVIGLVWQQRPRQADSDIIQAQLAEIENSIAQAVRAEQLLTIANIFAAQPGGEEHAREIYQEIAEHYPGLESQALNQDKL